MSADGARKLFVGGLSDTVSEQELRVTFENAGLTVEHLALPRDRETGRLRGFAFVTLASEDEASRARSQLQGVQCAGRPLSLREFSQEPPKRGTGERPERAPRVEQPTVFLGKLPFEATQAQIQELFDREGVGQIARLTLPLGPDGRPRGFGFAALSSTEQVEQAVEKLNGATLLGRQIVVNPAQAKGQGPRPREDGPRRSGGRLEPRDSSSPSFAGPPPAQDFDPYYPPEPPAFPPPEGKGGRRRDGKKEKKEKKRGAGGAANPRGASRRRGGGGNGWQYWDDED